LQSRTGDIGRAKKQKVNKSQAVRDYLKAHPKAMSGEIAAALNKHGIEVTPNYVATIKSNTKKARTAKRAAVAKTVTAVPASQLTTKSEKTAKVSATVTLEQVKAVAVTVKTLGGSVQLDGILVLIKEVGGLKGFKDLLDAMSATEANASSI
jgi:hypothetical protein